MSHTTIRLWYSLSVAVIAASVGDFCVEWASNAGWFGPGIYTDRSTVDIVPALAAGGLFAIVHFALRVSRTLASANADPWRSSRDALEGNVARLLPRIFLLQLLVLYVMETAEQWIVFKHGLGGTIWLGGPVLVSLAAHAVACALVAFALLALVKALARGALHVIRIIWAPLSPQSRAPGAIALRFALPNGPHALLLAAGNAGERAPPLPKA